MTKAQKQTLDRLRKKRELLRDSNGRDHEFKDDEVRFRDRDGDEFAIQPNGLVVPR